MQNRLWFTAAEPGEERIVAILPFFHAYGLTAVVLFTVTLGAEFILLPRFEPKGFLRMLRRTRPTFLAGVPSLFGAPRPAGRLRRGFRLAEGLRQRR